MKTDHWFTIGFGVLAVGYGYLGHLLGDWTLDKMKAEGVFITGRDYMGYRVWCPIGAALVGGFGTMYACDCIADWYTAWKRKQNRSAEKEGGA